MLPVVSSSKGQGEYFDKGWDLMRRLLTGVRCSMRKMLLSGILERIGAVVGMLSLMALTLPGSASAQGSNVFNSPDAQQAESIAQGSPGWSQARLALANSGYQLNPHVAVLPTENPDENLVAFHGVKAGTSVIDYFLVSTANEQLLGETQETITQTTPSLFDVQFTSQGSGGAYYDETLTVDNSGNILEKTVTSSPGAIPVGTTTDVSPLTTTTSSGGGGSTCYEQDTVVSVLYCSAIGLALDPIAGIICSLVAIPIVNKVCS